jgi:hypothetical protein
LTHFYYIYILNCFVAVFHRLCLILNTILNFKCHNYFYINYFQKRFIFFKSFINYHDYFNFNILSIIIMTDLIIFIYRNGFISGFIIIIFNFGLFILLATPWNLSAHFLLVLIFKFFLYFIYFLAQIVIITYNAMNLFNFIVIHYVIFKITFIFHLKYLFLNFIILVQLDLIYFIYFN